MAVLCDLVETCFLGRRRGWTVQLLFQELPGSEVCLATSGNVDDLPRSRVAGCGFWACLLNLKDAETTDLNPLSLHQALSHSLEHGVDHV